MNKARGEDGEGRRDTRVECGRGGEAIAEAYLKGLGFRLLDRHFVLRGGEIDLIMADGPTIVFVEVRRRRTEWGGDPFESISPRKRRHLVRAARIYLSYRKLHDRPCRFDAVSVRDREGAGPPEVRHLPDAFHAEGR
jgi:putative endonuclease